MARHSEKKIKQIVTAVAEGAVAAQTVLGTKTAVGKLRGRFHDYHGIQVMPTWHPAYLLRNPNAKRDVWDDVKKIRALLDESD